MVRLLNLIFQRTGTLCDALQSPNLEMDKCYRMVKVTLESLSELLCDTKFDELYSECVEFAEVNNTELPSISRKIRVPAKLQGELKERPVFKNAKDKFKNINNETIKSIINEIDTRFDDDTLTPLIKIEKIVKGNGVKGDLLVLKNLKYYENLVNFELLDREILTWINCLKSYANDEKYDLNTISSISQLFRDEVNELN